MCSTQKVYILASYLPPLIKYFVPNYLFNLIIYLCLVLSLHTVSTKKKKKINKGIEMDFTLILFFLGLICGQNGATFSSPEKYIFPPVYRKKSPLSDKKTKDIARGESEKGLSVHKKRSTLTPR